MGKDNSKLIACPVGRQLAVRRIDKGNNDVTVVERKKKVDQITALASISNNNDQKAIFAIGETDYNNPNDLFVDIYDVGKNGHF